MDKKTLFAKRNLDPKLSKPVKSGAQSIYKAISLLRIVAESSDKGIRLYEISNKLGLSSATAHRILNVLVSENFLDYSPISKRYNLGIELHSLGIKAKRFSLKEKYRICLENISLETGDSIFLLIRSGYDCLCTDYIDARSHIRVASFSVGTRKPLGMGSGSLALLAFSPKLPIEVVLKANCRRFHAPDWPYNKMTVLKVKSLIENARKSGFVYSDQFFIKDICSVGVPLYDHNGEVEAAISVASIASRMDISRAEKIAEFIQSEISLFQ